MATPQPLPRKYIGEHDAARLLNVSVRSLRRWRAEGNGPAFRKFGALVRYELSEVVAWSDAQGPRGPR